MFTAVCLLHNSWPNYIWKKKSPSDSRTMFGTMTSLYIVTSDWWGLVLKAEHITVLWWSIESLFTENPPNPFFSCTSLTYKKGFLLLLTQTESHWALVSFDPEQKAFCSNKLFSNSFQFFEPDVSFEFLAFERLSSAEELVSGALRLQLFRL